MGVVGAALCNLSRSSDEESDAPADRAATTAASHPPWHPCRRTRAALRSRSCRSSIGNCARNRSWKRIGCASQRWLLACCSPKLAIARRIGKFKTDPTTPIERAVHTGQDTSFGSAPAEDSGENAVANHRAELNAGAAQEVGTRDARDVGCRSPALALRMRSR